MDEGLWPTTEHLAKLTKAKVDFIEEQTGKMLDFVLASREILTREAHTTLQWLFAILIGAAGYLVSLFAKHYDEHPIAPEKFWWVIIPLIGTVIAAGFEARRLLYKGLLTGSIPSKGNSAQNILDTTLMDRPAIALRFLEAWKVDAKATAIRGRNGQIGEAINRARKAVILIPAFTMLGVVPLALMAWNDQPAWLAISIDFVLVSTVAVVLWATHTFHGEGSTGPAS